MFERIKITLAVCGGVLLMVSPVHAAGSGAFRVELPDAAAMGMGSAFVGEADTAAAVYYNPAGSTQIEGSQVKIGSTLLQPFATYRDGDDNKTDMKEHKFNIPHFYAVSDLGTDRFAFGLGATSNFGLATEWADDSFSKYVATLSKLETKEYFLTGAMQVNDQWSFSAGLDYTDSNVDKRKKLNQVTSDGDFQLIGEDTAWGYRLSTHYSMSEQHQFGFLYRSAKELKYEGHVRLSNLNSTAVLTIPGIGSTSYLNVFGGAQYSTPFEAKLTLPQSMVLGYSYKPNERWTFNADLEWMDWSSVDEELLTYPEESNAARLAVLNEGNPAHRDWDSVFSFGVGTEYKATEKLRLRTGYFFHETPIPDDTFDTSLPDSDSHSATIGFGYDIRQDLTFDMAYSAMFFKDRRVDNAVGAASAASIDGEYEQWMSILLVSITLDF